MTLSLTPVEAVERAPTRAENENVRTCRACGNGLEDRFRYCPWCAAPQRRKLVEFFAPHPAVPGDAHKALRVTRYFGDIGYRYGHIFPKTDSFETDTAIPTQRIVLGAGIRF